MLVDKAAGESSKRFPPSGLPSGLRHEAEIFINTILKKEKKPV